MTHWTLSEQIISHKPLWLLVNAFELKLVMIGWTEPLTNSNPCDISATEMFVLFKNGGSGNIYSPNTFLINLCLWNLAFRTKISLNYSEVYFVLFQNATIRLGKNHACRHNSASRRSWRSWWYVWRLGDGKLHNYNTCFELLTVLWRLLMKNKRCMLTL